MEQKQMSLRIRFMILIGVLSLLAILGISVASYKFSINNAMTEARAKGRLVFNFLESARLHFRRYSDPRSWSWPDLAIGCRWS